MSAYKCEFKLTAETVRLIERGGLSIISAIKTSGQIRSVNLFFCPWPQRSAFKAVLTVETIQTPYQSDSNQT